MSEKEYVVTLNKGTDYAQFNQEMIASTGAGDIPDRTVDVADAREKSTRNSGYRKGIYKRQNKKLKLMLVQINTPTFRPKIFDFFKVAEDTVRESFNRNLLKEIGR